MAIPEIPAYEGDYIPDIPPQKEKPKHTKIKDKKIFKDLLKAAKKDPLLITGDLSNFDVSDLVPHPDDSENGPRCYVIALDDEDLESKCKKEKIKGIQVIFEDEIVELNEE